MASQGYASVVLQHRAELADLCRRSHARRLHLFGSATRSDFRPADSDLDFLVELDEGLAPGPYSRAFFALKDGLEALFQRPVDLLTTEALRNPYLRQRVEAEQIPIYVS